jgi:GNAT superfamily N-acetyltransferase
MPQKANLGEYIFREAKLEDIPVLVQQRRAMFIEATGPKDQRALDAFDSAYKRYIEEMFAEGKFRAWLVENKSGEIIAGSGLSIYEKPPRPENNSTLYAYAHSTYTDPEYRRQGLAKAILTKIIEWCKKNEIKTVTIYGEPHLRPFYESLGFFPMPEMWLSIK